MLKLVLTGIMASALLLAQGEGRGGGGGRGHGGEGDLPLNPFSGATRLDRIADLLKLTKDQKKQFKTAMDDGQKEVTALRPQLLKARDAIAEAVMAGKSQDEVAQLVKANAALEAQVVNIELKAFATFYQTLSVEQQNKPSLPMVFQGMRGIFDAKNWNALD